MSLISSMNIAQQALNVNQAAITVVSNNIANVGTEGYSKLRVEQSSVAYVNSTRGNSAVLEAESLAGVTIDKITRYSDSFLQSYYWDQNSISSYLSQYSTTASNIESLTNELNTTGLSTALSNFYTAANALNNNASDITARTNYITAAKNVCAIFNNISSSLTDIRESLVGNETSMSSSQISSKIDDANDLLDQIANINQNIVKTKNDSSSSASLLDQRDALISKLSDLIPIQTEENDDGSISISLGEHDLVSGSEVIGHLKASNSTASGSLVTTVDIVNPDDSTKTLFSNINGDIKSGSIGAILDICGTDNTKLTISGIMDSLDDMASSFASVMNSIQTSTNYPSGTNTPMCMTSDGSALQVSSPTNYLFVNGTSTVPSTTGITAGNLSINSAIENDPYLIAAARVSDPTATGITNDIGNNSNITLVLNARTDASYYNGTSIQGNTLEKSLATMVSGVGAKVNDIENSSTTQATVMSGIESKLSAATGVDMNEELTDLIKYQRAYQAAARVFSTCSDLLEELVNLAK